MLSARQGAFRFICSAAAGQSRNGPREPSRSLGPCFWIKPPKLRPVQGWYEAGCLHGVEIQLLQDSLYILVDVFQHFFFSTIPGDCDYQVGYFWRVGRSTDQYLMLNGQLFIMGGGLLTWICRYFVMLGFGESHPNHHQMSSLDLNLENPKPLVLKLRSKILNKMS